MGVAQLDASVFCIHGHLNLNDSKTVKDWCLMVEIFRSHLNLEKGQRRRKDPLTFESDKSRIWCNQKSKRSIVGTKNIRSIVFLLILVRFRNVDGSYQSDLSNANSYIDQQVMSGHQSLRL